MTSTLIGENDKAIECNDNCLEDVANDNNDGDKESLINPWPMRKSWILK